MIRPGIRRLLRLPIRGRGSLAAEVEEEIRLHLSLRAEAMMRSGMPPEQAHAEALRRFGDLEEGRRQMRRTATRRARTMNGREWLATLWQDVRYGARQLRRNPGFTATAVLALGLGIGANTAIFSFVDALMLRPPAHVAAPDELVRIYTSGFSGELYGGSSYPDFLDFRSRLRGSADLAAFAGSTMTLDAGEQVESVPAEFVTTNYFSVLGIDPAAGRLMLPAGSRVEGDDAVAVISHSLWQRAFGGDAGVAGRVVRLNGSPLTIVGVAPQGFAGPGGRSPADAWIPIGQAPALRPSSSGGDILEQRSSRWLGIVGRPLPGVRPEAVAARVESIGAALYEQYPDEWSDVREVSRQVSTIAGRSTWLSPAAHGAITNFAALLMALVGLVLLIACANVANLLLARATKRRQELAVRLAIGAERGRIVRQLTTESCLLAAAAGIVGVVLALGTMGVLNGVGEALPFGGSVEVSLDGRVLVFAVAISLIAATLFGLLPALITARRDPAPVLRNEGANAGRGSGALRAGLVTGQVAICVVLLVCASLLVRSLRNAVDTELGFQPSGVLLVPLTAMPPQYTEAAGQRLFDAVVERVGALPGVEEVAIGSQVPLSGRYSRRGVSPEGYQPGQGEDMEIDFASVSPGYFDLMGIPLSRGRSIRETDRAGAAPVAVVNQAFVDRFWPGEDPIGRTVTVGRAEPVEIVGVTPTTKLRALDEAPRPNIYLPVQQSFFGLAMLHLRTRGDPLALLPSARSAIEEVAPGMPLTGARTFEETIAGQVLPLRMAGTLFSAFGLVALTISMIGLYGILAYAVGQRTREIGIRIALGARGGRLARGIVQRGMLLVAAGAALGLLGGLFATRPMAGLLFGVSATDPAAIGFVTLLLVVVSLLATYLPARRATRVDPMVALRQS